MDILELYKKPKGYNFTDKELDFIKLNNPRSDFKALYVFHKTKKNQACFIIDTACHSKRKSGVQNYWEVFSERQLCEIEYDELVRNFGTNTRRFVVYEYDGIDQLVMDDRKYGVQTPVEFVNEFRKRHANLFTDKQV